MKKKYRKGGVIGDWMKKALTELKKESGFKLKKAHMDIDHVSDENAFYAIDKDSEYLVFKDASIAERYAQKKAEDDIDNEPELFSKSFLEEHYYVSDTDRRLIAIDEADMITSDNGLNEGDAGYDEMYKEIYDKWYNGLKNPVRFLVEEEGMYSMEDLSKVSFLSIDSKEASKDAVNQDGVAHFIASYDGEEIELPSGAVAYRIN